MTELQRAVGGLQVAADKKDSLHQRLQAKLEEQISSLQGRQLQVRCSLLTQTLYLPRPMMEWAASVL